jgi:hypothetical protein
VIVSASAICTREVFAHAITCSAMPAPPRLCASCDAGQYDSAPSVTAVELDRVWAEPRLARPWCAWSSIGLGALLTVHSASAPAGRNEQQGEGTHRPRRRFTASESWWCLERASLVVDAWRFFSTLRSWRVRGAAARACACPLSCIG